MAVGLKEYFRLLTGKEFEAHALGDKLTEVQAMEFALARGLEGLGTAAPNPAVGCVILDSENKLLASGYHRRAGEAHAEINALAQIAGVTEFRRNEKGWDITSLPKEKLKGARVFVTLEPCSHEGKTPSCAKTLSQLPLREVIFGIQDPNPQVHGKGAAILKQAGIEVQCLPLAKGLKPLIEIFETNQLKERPFVSLKCASSLDGTIALGNGQSHWITSESAREMGHYLRGLHSALLVGAGTVLNDNPKLTVRHEVHPSWDGKLIVLDPHGEVLLNPNLQIFSEHSADKIILVTQKMFSGIKTPFQILDMDLLGGAFSIPDLLNTLWKMNIRSVFVEGGGSTISEFLRQKSADRMWLFQAPSILGTGRAWNSTLALTSMDQRVLTRDINKIDLGYDQLITGRISV